MDKFRQCLTELSARNSSVFLFLDDNFNRYCKYQWIFTKLCVRIDIVETCFGITDGQIPLIFDSYLTAIHPSQWIFTKFDMYIYTVEICFGIGHWQIPSMFDRVICPRHK